MNWENGLVNLSIDKINKISNVLDVNPFELMSFDEKVYFENCKNGIFGYVNNNNTYHSISDNERIIYEKLIKSLESQIERLSKEDSSLR